MALYRPTVPMVVPPAGGTVGLLKLNDKLITPGNIVVSLAKTKWN